MLVFVLGNYEWFAWLMNLQVWTFIGWETGTVSLPPIGSCLDLVMLSILRQKDGCRIPSQPWKLPTLHSTSCLTVRVWRLHIPPAYLYSTLHDILARHSTHQLGQPCSLALFMGACSATSFLCGSALAAILLGASAAHLAGSWSSTKIATTNSWPRRFREGAAHAKILKNRGGMQAERSLLFHATTFAKFVWSEEFPVDPMFGLFADICDKPCFLTSVGIIWRP